MRKYSLMRLKIIGSAAGGGFPQWNCNYRLSRAAWNGQANVRARTQSSLAASANGNDWILFNASPDIRQQIAATPELQPKPDGPLRSTPIRAVVLTNADVDHIAGLLSMREREPFVLYASRRVLDVLDSNSIFKVLDRSIVERRELVLNRQTTIVGTDAMTTGITVETFPVPGKVALFLEDPALGDNNFGTQDGDAVGLKISSPDGAAAFYIPGCARIEECLKTRLTNAQCLLFDGTVFTDDEMIRAGVGVKTGARMGHIHIAGDDGSMAAIGALGIRKRIYVHINNTNPILDATSPAPQRHVRAGWKVAFDGMEIQL